MNKLAAAKEFVRRAVAGAADWQLGSGHGPLDQAGWTPAR
jgi:hydroxymethylpyrimidine/phosphomethylpyrimidine kinase